MSADTIKDIVTRAKKAAPGLSTLDTAVKDRTLLAMAVILDEGRAAIKAANDLDVKKAVEGGKDPAFIDRLKLNDKRIDGMRDMMKEVAALKDPLWKVIDRKERPNGLIVEKVRVPIGVIGIIYESRPNVTADCIALCFKSGNAVILRGGTDAINSNKVIYSLLKKAASLEKLDEGVFQLIEDTKREAVDEMLQASWGIDLIMPRGGESLIRNVVEKSRIPVIKHYKGVCHVYIDLGSERNMALDIAYNAKVQRPGVCNAMETLLVHEGAAGDILPEIARRYTEAGVVMKGCPVTVGILKAYDIVEAREEDYYTEYSALKMNIRVVHSIDEAIAHISGYGSHHSDAIVTNNAASAEKFLREVDSAAVYVNASTRFTDGGEFGLGAEIGISTDKIHARGPMGLEELTIYKYIVRGAGQIRR
ncbi:MAG: glutamate-5-semialdehyde dehydrogenase [Candidatus Omnitrophica bacterium]|nr:glutamate-5-semialdehyde dehydrogenase [Candidatus Omnitrophota bacterium]